MTTLGPRAHRGSDFMVATKSDACSHADSAALPAPQLESGKNCVSEKVSGKNVRGGLTIVSLVT